MATQFDTSGSDRSSGAGSTIRGRFPDPLAFLLICLAFATAATYLVPAGEYDRRVDPATGRRVVVADTFHRVAAAHVSPFAALVAIPRGFTDAGSVIVFVLLAGAGLTVVERTGALQQAATWLIVQLRGRRRVIIAVISMAFATGGVVEGMLEEIIPLVPLLLVVTGRLGYSPVTAVAISLGSAAIGGAFSPMNPFGVGIAQRLAGVPLLSGSTLRLVFLTIAVAFWIWAVLRQRPDASTECVPEGPMVEPLGARTAMLLVMVALAFAVYVVGVLKLGWEFEQGAAIFFLLGLVAGVVGGLGVDGTATALTNGLRGMASAVMLIALARSVYLVLDAGHVIDTIVYGLLVPITHLPRVGASIAMMLAQAVLHVPVPSTSGQAVLSIPILVPLADLLGMSAQVPVLAFQFGAGLCELVTPTNGPMMAILAAAGVSYDKWLRFFLPWYVVLMTIGCVALGIAVMAAGS